MKIAQFLAQKRLEDGKTREEARTHKHISPEEDYAKRKATMRSSIKEGSLHNVMVGFSDQFITPFALVLGATTGVIGFLSSFPQLIGAIVQLYADQMTRIFSNRVRLITIASFLQAALWLPFLLLPHISGSIVVLIGLVTLFNILGMFQSPIWNAIMGDVVPADQRGKYFGKRTFRNTVALFFATFLAGLILDFAKSGDYVILGFSVIFFVAFASKFLSTFYKANMYDPAHPKPEPLKGEFLSFLKNMNKTNFGRFTLYFTILKIALGFSAPFFAVYEIRDLHFDYVQFTIIAVISIITGFMSLKWWGNLIDLYGSRNITLVNAFLVPLWPLVWVVFPSFYPILIGEALSGISWAGFNLASSNFLFDATVTKKRTAYVAYFNFYAAVGVFIGASVAVYLSTAMPIIPSISTLSRIPVFLVISAILRFVAALFFLTRTHESRLVEISFEKTLWNIPLGRSVMIMPNSGAGVIEVGGSKRQIDVPPLHHKDVHPKHFDHTHHEATKEDEEWVHRFLQKSGTGKQQSEVSPKSFKETLITDPMYETKEVDDILDRIKKGKFLEKPPKK